MGRRRSEGLFLEVGAGGAELQKPRNRRSLSERKKGKEANEETKREDRPWPMRLLETRRLATELEESHGSDGAATRKLVSTLKDPRAHFDVALRRTTLGALVPAARIGHRDALEAQIKALSDPEGTVRRAAVEALWAAAGEQRPAQGSPVGVALSQCLPLLSSEEPLVEKTSSSPTKKRSGKRISIESVGSPTSNGKAESNSLASPPSSRPRRGSISKAGAASPSSDAPPGRNSGKTTEVDAALPSLPAPPRRDPTTTPEERRAAAHAIERLGPRGNAAMIETVKFWLDDKDEQVRASSLRALGQIGVGDRGGKARENEDVAKVVAARLDDPSWKVRQAAVEALERVAVADVAVYHRAMAAAAKEDACRGAVAASVGAEASHSDSGASDHSSSVKSVKSSRRGSRKSVRSANRQGKRATAELGRACRGTRGVDAGSLPRIEAVRALGRVALPRDGGVVQAITEVLRDGDENLRCEAVNAAQKFTSNVSGKDGATVRSSILAASSFVLGSEDWRFRNAASKVICNTATVAEEGDVLGLVTGLLEQGDWRNRRAVGPTLRQLVGAKFQLTSVLEALDPWLQHADWTIRRKTVEAMGEVAEGVGGKRAVVRRFAAISFDPEEEVRRAVAIWLPAASPTKSKEAISVLTPMALGDSDVDVRRCSLRAIGQLAATGRSRSRAAIRVLATGLEDDDSEARLIAVEMLRQAGRGRRTAIDVVSKQLGHADEHVRQAAAAAFQGIVDHQTTQLHKRLFQRTMPYIQHGEKGVREAAVISIDAIRPKKKVVGLAELQSPSLGGTISSPSASTIAPLDSAAELSTDMEGPDPKEVLKAASLCVARFAHVLNCPKEENSDAAEDRKTIGSFDDSATSPMSRSSGRRATIVAKGKKKVAPTLASMSTTTGGGSSVVSLLDDEVGIPGKANGGGLVGARGQARHSRRGGPPPRRRRTMKVPGTRAITAESLQRLEMGLDGDSFLAHEVGIDAILSESSTDVEDAEDWESVFEQEDEQATEVGSDDSSTGWGSSTT
eukprot:TRINITY_DN6752_c0_g1_i10.p1 TRINITY_DN6752_c0_g1~~TRINITY_DN6752_c0_g1_i10.p1  ORF type:complete len:1022 (+),score=214.54 TRINITY_DN6752_c0_g1_i10:182-3247(+)